MAAKAALRARQIVARSVASAADAEAAGSGLRQMASMSAMSSSTETGCPSHSMISTAPRRAAGPAPVAASHASIARRSIISSRRARSERRLCPPQRCRLP